MSFWDNLNSAITTASDWIGDKWNRVTGKSSAHQLEVEDMKKAGLNPIMSSSGSSVGSSGGNPVSAGSSALNGIASVISSAASLTNNKNVDKSTTKQIYNSAGRLMKTVETYTRK
ncbi:MAG: hypothetical protein E7374_02905 [Clostridiales bacterium]|nr:hypothetical protein [Clostridiales bacterium]